MDRREKQLLCMARAILRHSKVLIMDEVSYYTRVRLEPSDVSSNVQATARQVN
jgi:ABC-type branched-subunit amino acid transport system ATPase component